MTDNVLDLIDNVVEEHELLSPDAMRWAPDAPDPTPAGPLPAEVWDRCIVDETHEWVAERLARHIHDLLGVQVTLWQHWMLANPNLTRLDETRMRRWLNGMATEDTDGT